jgi:hypothetical protein
MSKRHFGDLDVGRDITVGTTGYGLDDQGIGIRLAEGARFFSSPQRPGLLPRDGVKQPRLEAEHSSPTSVEVKNTWIYTPIPPYAFMV